MKPTVEAWPEESQVDRLYRCNTMLFEQGFITLACARRAERRIKTWAEKVARKEQTLCARIERRLAVPCAPGELSAMLSLPVHNVRALLYQMGEQGRARRTDRTVASRDSGRPEHLWERA